MAVTITVNGVTATRVRFAGSSIREVNGPSPNTGTLTFNASAPAGGEQIVITNGATTLFAGQAQKVSLAYDGKPANKRWDVSLIDETFLANQRRPFGTYVNVSATTIANAILAAYAPDVSNAGVAASLPSISINFDGSEPFWTAFQRIATMINGRARLDYANVAHLSLTYDGTAPDNVDTSHPPLDTPPITFSTDLSQVRTRMYGKGHEERLLADVASGETILPIGDPVQFNSSTGHVIAGTTSDGAQTQILGYTGKTTPTGGSLVGPGAAPSSAPGLALVAGAGLGTGVYKYAYTDVTAAGESLPSPLGTITTANTPAPSTALSASAFFVGGNMTPGVYSWAVTFVTASGETTQSPLYTFTVGGNWQATLINIPIGDARVTSRKLYRTVSNGSQLKLLLTIADNTTTTIGDNVADGSLGANVPTSNTATANQVAVSGIAIGASPTTSRKVYRTAVGGSQLKLLTTIANNTTTTYADSTADGSLGANAPTGDTSGLTQPTGQVNAGSTSLLLAGAGPFSSTGGWAILPGSQMVRYTGISGNTLTGIPASGAGAIVTTVLYGSQAVPAPSLENVTGLTVALAKGSSIAIWVQRDDIAAQTALAALEKKYSGAATDGIREDTLFDGRLGEAALIAACDARLAVFKTPIVSVTYATRDTKTRAGASVHIDMSTYGLAGDYTIQDVTISFDGRADAPTVFYHVKAASVAFTLSDVLRLVQLTTP